MRISHRSRERGPKAAAVVYDGLPLDFGLYAQAFCTLNAEPLTASPAGVVEPRREGK